MWSPAVSTIDADEAGEQTGMEYGGFELVQEVLHIWSFLYRHHQPRSYRNSMDQLELYFTPPEFIHFLQASSEVCRDVAGL